MNELKSLIMRTTNGRVAVNARDLHDFLEIGKDFSTWFKDMVDYGFTEGKDFSPISGKSSGGRPRIEYAVTLNMAKELSMVQRTEKGKQARRYFIAMEGQAKKLAVQAQLPTTSRGQIQLLMRGNEETNQRIDQVEQRVTDIEDNQRLDPDQYGAIRRRVSHAVYEYIDDCKLLLTNKQRSELFKDLNGGINKVTHVTAQTQLRANDFATVMHFISHWTPSTVSLELIKQMGEQTAMEV